MMVFSEEKCLQWELKDYFLSLRQQTFQSFEGDMYSNRVETVIEFVAYITETYRIEDREGEQKESQWETEAKMDYFFFFGRHS